jgi:hypothetical protein
MVADMTEREDHLKAMTAIRMQGVGAYGDLARTKSTTDDPGYPPEESASGLLDDEMRYGSTGYGYGATAQLWVVHNGKWVRK